MIAMMGSGRGGWRGSWLRRLMWAGALFLLVLPAVAMRFTAEVDWTASGFVFAAIMLFGSAGLVELAARASSGPLYLWGAIFAVVASFLTVWVNAAVGMIQSEDNPYNLLFLGVVGLAFLGSALARFRARGMAMAMMLAAGAQALLGAIGIAADPRGGVFSILFALIWLISAIFLRNAAVREASAA